MKILSKDLIEIRPRTKCDYNLILATWLPGLYYGNNWFNEIDKDAYFSQYRKVIQAILARPSVYLNAAVLKEDPDVILGYAVLEDRKEGSVLHWLYTKPLWRKLGIAKELLPPNITTVTHLTKTGRSMKPKEWKFDPFV